MKLTASRTAGARINTPSILLSKRVSFISSVKLSTLNIKIN